MRKAVVLLLICILVILCSCSNFTQIGNKIYQNCVGNLTPCLNNTFNIGDNLHYFHNAYISHIYTDSGAIGASNVTTPGGTVDYVAKFNSSTNIVNSSIKSNTTAVYVLDKLNLQGDVYTDRWLNQDTNTFLGVDVAGNDGLTHTVGSEGYGNTGVGNRALYNINSSYFNTAVGYFSLASLTNGIYNTAVGVGTLTDVTTGNFNTAVGMQALNQNNGSYNTALGLFAGHINVTGDNNVFLGAQAGKNELGSNKLYIDSSDTATPLIYGDFSTDTLTINNNLIVSNYLDLSGLNVTYVPLTGNIQTYINNAAAGDTLILASGQYTITSTITVGKQINIKGQGSAGFLTSPVTAGHGTLISSTTNAIVGFQINADNVRISDLSINLTGNASTGINTANNLKGIVLRNIDVIVTCAGLAQGFAVYGSNIVMRDSTFYIQSTNNGAYGFWLWNDSSTTQNAIADCFGVTGTAVGAATCAYAFACENINDANVITLNLSNSVCRSLTGTPLDIAVASLSTTTSTAVVNAYMCTFDGADYDAYQTNSNQLNLGGSVLVNKKVFGTATYRAMVTAGTATFGSVPVFANNAAALAGGVLVGGLYRSGGDPDILCIVH